MSRREYLRCAGLAGLSVLTSGCRYLNEDISTPSEPYRKHPLDIQPPIRTQQSAAPDYEIITVEAGATYTDRITTGETFSNKLIDISADGATFRIEASGRNWSIRNVGISGVWDVNEDAEPLSVAVEEGGAGLIENFYFADGTTDDSYPGVTGIYVKRRHAGTLRINSVNIQHMPGNAIYASTPGYPSDNAFGLPGGGGGVVEITNSFAADCLASHFRIGTTGSFVENCVAVGGDRGLWARFEVSIASNCDFSGSNDGDIAVGAQQWDDSQQATVGLEDCRYETTTTYWQENRIIGTSVGPPRTEPPDSVPLTARDAAEGYVFS